MDRERILQLLAKRMGQEASDAENAELQELLLRYPKHHLLVEMLESMDGEKVHSEPAIGAHDLVSESWCMLNDQLNILQKNDEDSNDKNQIRVSKLRVRKIWISRAAIWAGIIVIAGGFFFVWMRTEKKQSHQPVAKIEKVIIPNGAPEMKLLPDSSIVWINAGSQIRYADNFIQKNREVYLDGEAYFNVRHDAKHPFIVHAGSIAVRALGTKFNVHAYQNENKVEATLISGKVQITIEGKPDQKIILMPDEKLTVINEKFRLPAKQSQIEGPPELSFQVKKVVPMSASVSIPEVAWLQDNLAFQNEAFDLLAKRMERRYDVRIVFKDTVLKNERLTGIFKSENIEKAFKILQMTTPFHYKVEGDTIYVNR